MTQEEKRRDRTNLRLDPEMLSKLDHARRRRPGSVSRNTWILEAIQEKLAREQDNSERKAPGRNANG